MTFAPPGLVLASNASATTTPVYWLGGSGMVSVSATFGGGTVKLQFLGPDGSTYIDADAGSSDSITRLTFTANGGGIFTGGPCWLRLSIATATAVYGSISPIIAN